MLRGSLRLRATYGEPLNAAPTRTRQALSHDRYYTAVAVATFLIVFAGFARTYFLKVWSGARPLPIYLHLHWLIFTLWFALFFVQARLVARHRVALHRRLGILGGVLAAVAAPVAAGVSIHAVRRAYLVDPASLTLHARPFALDLGSSVTFALLVAAALYLRRRSDIHKRLMVLASCSLLLPAIGRIPFLFALGGLWGLVVLTEITPIVCIIYDTARHRRLHPGFGWGGLALLSSFPVFLLFGGTALWLRAAQWLVSR
jgi:hypothetical protein